MYSITKAHSITDHPLYLTSAMRWYAEGEKIIFCFTLVPPGLQIRAEFFHQASQTAGWQIGCIYLLLRRCCCIFSNYLLYWLMANLSKLLFTCHFLTTVMRPHMSFCLSNFEEKSRSPGLLNVSNHSYQLKKSDMYLNIVLVILILIVGRVNKCRTDNLVKQLFLNSTE